MREAWRNCSVGASSSKDRALPREGTTQRRRPADLRRTGCRQVLPHDCRGAARRLRRDAGAAGVRVGVRSRRQLLLSQPVAPARASGLRPCPVRSARGAVGSAGLRRRRASGRSSGLQRRASARRGGRGRRSGRPGGRRRALDRSRERGRPRIHRPAAAGPPGRAAGLGQNGNGELPRPARPVGAGRRAARRRGGRASDRRPVTRRCRRAYGDACSTSRRAIPSR